ncbi:hydroxymethylpyrimidine/phosphomethylpyrimidine kinase [Candidatus Thioglobus sp.]|nr:hydroxymethylpyrimidine/phosphomethylpyrimidine kinase [Candidatus Thioglobus sp.]
MDRPKADSVLLFSGLDPSGAAGISADIETLKQFGLVALPIVTSLTAQNTQKVDSIDAIKDSLLVKQFNLIVEDILFNTVKIGLLASASQIKTIARLINEQNISNVVVDPILISGTQENLSSNKMIEAMKNYLFPISKLITPNLQELSLLAPGLSEQEAVKSLNCSWVLVTTSDSSENEIEHRLYNKSKLIRGFRYKKLPNKFHGSGCTLSSAISALLSKGIGVEDACNQGLSYTYQCLLTAKKLGKMQYHPNRIPYKSK